MGYFAHITGLSAYTDVVSGVTVEGYKAIVDNVIVADQAFINSGTVGDSNMWVETFLEGNSRNFYAGKNYFYDSIKDAFYPPQPYPSWVLKQVIVESSTKDRKDWPSKLNWVAPIDKPTDGATYIWDETKINWVPYVEPNN